MMIYMLTGLLVIVAVWLVLAVQQREKAQHAANIPQGYKVLSADLGHEGAMGSRGAVLLRDNEWGITGKVDLLLEGPDGPVPVEVKKPRGRYEPGRAKPWHELQLGTAMILCEGDGRIGRRPAEGWIRYVDARGQVLPGGEIRIPNATPLRNRVITLVQRMRRALLTKEEVHRDHRSAAKCAKCSMQTDCDEAIG